MDIEYIANLARISLSENEIKKLKGQFKDILEYVEKLGKVNTDDVLPTSHILPVKNIFREDIVKESIPPKKALSSAPASKDNLFKVPKVVEGE